MPDKLEVINTPENLFPTRVALFSDMTREPMNKERNKSGIVWGAIYIYSSSIQYAPGLLNLPRNLNFNRCSFLGVRQIIRLRNRFVSFLFLDVAIRVNEQVNCFI